MASKKPNAAQAVALRGFLATLPQNPPVGYREGWEGRNLCIFFYSAPHCGEFYRITPEGQLSRY